MACSCGPRGSPCFDMSNTCMTRKPGSTRTPMLPSSGHLAGGRSDYVGSFARCWAGAEPVGNMLRYDMLFGTPAGPSVLQQRGAPVACPSHAVGNARQGTAPDVHLYVIVLLRAACLPGQPDLRTGPGKDADLCRRTRANGVSIQTPAQRKHARTHTHTHTTHTHRPA
jgi:hypothetical protein